MSEITPITIISQAEILEKIEKGLLAPMAAGEDIKVVDCGDHRSLTTESSQQREDYLGERILPARYFGGGSGLAFASVVTVATQSGEQVVQDFFGGISAESLTDFTADLTHRAKMQMDVDIYQHSAVSNEGNPLAIADDHQDRETPLGCALAHNIGVILHKAAERSALLDAKAIASECGQDLPLEELQEGVIMLAKHVPSSLSIHRGALHHAVTKSNLHTPIAILEDAAATQKDDLAAVIDLGGYRSQAGVNQYHHTPGIAANQLPKLFPEFEFDEKLVAASGLLIGAATRAVLSGEKTPHALSLKVIPAEYSAAVY